MRMGRRCIRRTMVSAGLAVVMLFQSIFPAFGASDEIHLINDLGSGGKGSKFTLEEESERNWGEDLVSVAKGAWYDAHRNDDEDAGVRKATSSSLITSADYLANAFEDFDEVKAQKDVEKLLKKADKESISQSGTWLSHMLKEAVIPKEAVPREATLKTEIMELYKLNNDDYTVFHTEKEWIPRAGDVVFFAKTAEKKATESNIVATSADLRKDMTGDLRIKRRADKAAIGGIIIDAPDRESGIEQCITFLYSTSKDKVDIGYMPLDREEIIGVASMQNLRDKYCGIRSSAPFEYAETIDGYCITLTAKEGVFPVGTEVHIRPVTEIEGQNIHELIDDGMSENEKIAQIVSFDISFTHDGKELQPEDGSVSVSISLPKELVREITKDKNSEISVYHIESPDNIDEIDSEFTNEKELVYEAESFSVYSIVLKAAAGFTPRLTAPTGNTTYYYTSQNPLYSFKTCTWYAWGRAWEILGKKHSLPTNAAEAWWEVNKTYPTGQVPALGAIACWGIRYDSRGGHVAVVEKIEGDTVTVSEAGTSTDFHISKMKADGTYISGWNSSTRYPFRGYIYVYQQPEAVVKPKILDVQVSSVTSSDYLVYVYANPGTYPIKEVRYPTWTEANGQDDLAHGKENKPENWEKAVYDSAKGCWACHVYDYDHNYEKGQYITHIYVYDDHGNSTGPYVTRTKLENKGEFFAEYTWNGHTYRLISDNLTWAQAKAACEKAGGHLATITSAEEQQAVEVLMEDTHQPMGRGLMYLGGNVVNGKVQWVTGEKSSYTNWGTGQPDNAGGKENTLSIYTGEKRNDLYGPFGLWNDYIPDSIGCGYILEIDPRISSVKLDVDDLNLCGIGTSYKLSASVKPDNAVDKTVVWRSSNPSVAWVSSDGTVKAQKEGTAVISAITAQGNKTAKCNVTVREDVIVGLIMSPTEVTVMEGDTVSLALSARHRPNMSVNDGVSVTKWIAPFDNRPVRWTSDNLAVATVESDGTVKAVKAGTAIITATSADGKKTASCTVTVNALKNGWVRMNGKDYWYENGVKQGTEGRGKEIYDPGSDAWYWLDAVQGGAKAVNKEVYMDYADKWVRYDANGHMIKGWYSNSNGTYYYNLITGAMTKGEITINNIPCYFNATTGVGHDGWRTYSGKNYWYEHGERQGTKYDKNGVKGDGTIRGREIYDPGTKAWYWLDAVYDGAKAEKKEVWMPYIFQNENPKTGGKWVRYNSTGGMVKGWYTVGSKKYYYDPTTGAMTKGSKMIDGRTYYFDNVTGVLR